MRIALVSRYLATDAQSGLNRATSDLARGLARIGHEVHVLAERPRDGALDLPAEIHDVRGELPLEWAAAAHGRLARIHATQGLDVACTPLWGASGIFAVRDPRFPTVVSCMTSAKTLLEIDPALLDGPAASEVVHLERVYVQGARHLHGLTRAVLEKTLADYAGAPLTTRVVGRGLRDVARAGRPRRADGRVEILFVGRDERRKGIDVLLESVRALLAEGAPIRLTLAGATGDAGDDRVRFEGFVTDQRLRELYAGADIVCQPSRYESHGIVLTEAMMFGKPIVATTGGGIPEVLEHEGNALLVAPGDAAELAAALRALVADPAKRARFGASSRERFLGRHEAGAVARQMTALFEEAVEAHAHHPADGTATALLARSLEERAATAEAERDDWRLQAEIVNGKLWQLQRSRTWRLTQPLRGVARVTRRRARAGIRGTSP